MITTINGDIVDIVLSNPDGVNYFVHQVNCRRVAGMGLAAQFRKRVPGWYTDFLETEPELGKIHFFPYKNNFIVNLYGQNGYGYNRQYTVYEAVGAGLIQLADRFDYIETVYIPYGMGAGLGGGEWSLISSIAESALKDHNIIYVRKK